MSGAGRSHPNCWTGDHYEHLCAEPSGRPCVDCGEPAGTPWGPMWCPPCDVVRLDRISASLASLALATEVQTATPSGYTGCLHRYPDKTWCSLTSAEHETTDEEIAHE